jgi:hypothetical protein
MKFDKQIVIKLLQQGRIMHDIQLLRIFRSAILKIIRSMDDQYNADEDTNLSNK